MTITIDRTRKGAGGRKPRAVESHTEDAKGVSPKKAVHVKATEKPARQAFNEFRRQVITSSPQQMIHLIRNGASAYAYAGVAEFLELSRSNLARVIGVSESTMERKIKSNSVLGPAESERLVRVVKVEAEAEQVFGSSELAKQWLQKANRSLGATPLALLDTETGANEVRKVLTAIAYGGVI